MERNCKTQLWDEKQNRALFLDHPVENTTALLYFVKMGEERDDREPNVTEVKRRNLVVSLETPDHNYCRIPSKFFECGGRLAISKQQGPIRMERRGERLK